VHNWDSIVLYVNMIRHTSKAPGQTHSCLHAVPSTISFENIVFARLSIFYKVELSTCFQSKNGNICFVNNVEYVSVSFVPASKTENHLCQGDNLVISHTMKILRWFSPGVYKVVDGHIFRRVLCCLQLWCQLKADEFFSNFHLTVPGLSITDL